MSILQILLVCILTVYAFAIQEYVAGSSEEEYQQIKRLFFATKSTTTTAPSIVDNLIYPSSGSCTSNPCEHGGICTSTGQMTFQCRCIGPWRGVYCGVANACYNAPCQNGGTCLSVYDDYWCKCTSDYYGQNCQTKFSNPSSSNNNCQANTCNTGRCISLQTTYYCQCPDDRHGEHCEKRFHKRAMSNRQSFYELLNQMKREMHKPYDGNDYVKGGRAYYDFKNGIYFKK